MPFSLHLAQPETHTLSIDLAADGVAVRGSLTAKDLALQLTGDETEVRCVEAEISNLEIQVGDLALKAESLSGESLVIGLGEAGLRLEAASLSGPALSVSLGTIELALGNYSLRDVAVHGAVISVGQGSVASVEVNARFDSKPKPGKQPETVKAAPSPPAAGPTIFDWHLLDGLRGDFNVDLGVDLTVPVIGRRQATHRFRVPIDGGAVDYMGLEKDLSTLESTLLDFAVRDDGTLVLERGIPLLPTRGRGKPILIWRLEPEDLALARNNRIRLAVFPQFEIAGRDEPQDPDAASPVALRSLTLGNLETRLVLGEGPLPLTAAVRRLTFDELTLRGEVSHHPDQAPQTGLLCGEAQGLGVSLVDLPLGASRLSLEQFQLGAIVDLDVRFSGLTPETLSCILRALSFEALNVASG